MITRSDVCILLASFNGEKYIKDQIESIINQTYNNWSLIIRDDGSSDNTNVIISSYIKLFPEKIFMINDNKGNLGAKQNYFQLLSFADSPYIMFADQDDVWLPTKIELCLQKIQSVESIYGTDTPLLVHTDMIVVDDELNEISESFWDYQYINPEKGKAFNRLLMDNVVTGCTVMINKKLKDMAAPIPEQAYMHDWWLALVASAFGKVDYLKEKTMLYRQHQNNEIGARPWNMKYAISIITSFNKLRAIVSSYIKIQKQADVFKNIFDNNLEPHKQLIINAFTNLQYGKYVDKVKDIIKFEFYRTGFLRNLCLLIIIFYCSRGKQEKC